MSTCLAHDSQGDDVGVGGFHGDADGVFLLLVLGVVVSASLQEQTHQPARDNTPGSKVKGRSFCASV